MKPRKKIQLLFCAFCILYAFGNGGCALADDIEHRTEDNTISKDDSTSVDSTTTTTAYSKSYRVDYSNVTESVGKTTTPNDTSNSIMRVDETTTESFACKDTPSSVQNLTVTGTNTTLYVTWESVTSIDDCILSYNLTWCSDSDYLESITVDSNASDFTITGLTPCTYYNISVVAVGEYGRVSDAQTVATNTTESQISEVTNLVVSGIEYGLNVTWNPPEDTFCLNSYLVDIVTNDNVTQSSETDLCSVTFYNLLACTDYIVRVTPISIHNNSGTVATASNSATLSSVPGAVNNLTAPSDQITGSSVNLTWSAPTSNQNCVLYYNVNICYQDNCTEANATDTFYYATNLSPCLTYTFTVSAVSSAGSSDTASTTANTSYIVPGEVTGMGTIPGQFSLFIYWEPPQTGSTCTASYRITLWDDGQTEVTTNTNITMSDLSACKNYTIQITPISTSGGEGPFVTISGSTGESVDNPPVPEIEANVTKSTISIVWRINRTMNECELKTVLTTCNFTSTTGHGFDKINGKSEDDISRFGSSTNFTIDVTISNLSPFSWYDCTGVIENVAGYGNRSTSVTTRTAEDVPSAPTMTISSLESSEFTLLWAQPDYLPGDLIEHEIVLSWERLFLMPSTCVYNDSFANITDIEGSALEYIHLNAIAYSNYSASIRAKTSAGWGNYSDYISFQTDIDVPGAVTNITYLNTTNSNDSNVLDTFLTWKLPCSLNGEIESFYIYFNGIRNNFETHVSNQVYNVSKDIIADEIFTINFGELYAEYNYTFEISAKVAGVIQLGPSNSYNVLYPAGIPPLPAQWYIDEITADMYLANRTSSKAWVMLPIFEDTNGEIVYYAVMISEIGQTNSTESRFDILSGNWPHTISWQEAMSHTSIITYQATPIRWHPAATDEIVDYGHLKAVKFLLGSDDSCSELSTPSYCNGPLRSDTQYQIHMRAFTNGGYRDSQPIFAKTRAEFNLGMVIGVVFGIIFLGIITVMMLLVRKGVLQTVLSNILHPSVQSSPGPEPLTRKKFELHCKELIDNPGKLSNEFQLLQTLSVDLEMSATAAGLQANRRKNRYVNILPYDISRVKLEILNNDPNSDYINASLIPGYSGSTEYIACQGPKEETTYDFWRMIFQYNVKVIVMVTQLVEKGKDKCHQYYPNTRENFEYEDMMIRCSTQLDFVFYTQRIITLQKENVKRTIMHLHFKEWSDHGVPDDVHSMINFCQIVRKLINEYKGLAVIHCSAGVGRTGTLIAIDILLQQIKDNKKLDIFGTVYKLRQHRVNMVQTESQYAYIYNCTKQALINPYPPKHYVTSSIEPVYENLTKNKREIRDSNTNLVNSAETLKKISPSLSTVSMEPIYENTVPQRPVYTSQLSTLSNGLRHSKSTSAINDQTPSDLQLDRFTSQDYPIFEPAPDSPSGRTSTDRTSFLEFTRPLRFEMKAIRPLSMNCDENTDYSIQGISPNF